MGGAIAISANNETSEQTPAKSMCNTEIEAIIRKSPLLASVIQRWDSVQLKNCWLAAGSLARTIWNNKFGFPVNFGISDVDLVYFDPDDLSASSELRHADRIRRDFDNLSIWFDVKNEARVHLWYEEKFGVPIAPYKSIKDAISTFPTTATAVGIRPQGTTLEFYSPFELDDLMGGVVRANKAQISREVYEAKVDKWTKIWPDLIVIDWNDERVPRR